MSVISFVEGTPGNGKSLLAVGRAFRLLERGGVACFNFPLSDNWALKFAQRIKPHFDIKKQVKLAEDIWSRAFRFGTVESLYELSELTPKLITGRAKKKREGQALAVFDECSLLFNSRDWQRNFPYIVFFINARKMKYHCLLMSHSHEDVDIQIQRKCELIIATRCMTKRKFCGVEIGQYFKLPRFRVTETIFGSGAGKGTKEDKYWFKLPLHICDLYDTDHVFTMEDFEEPLGKLGESPKKLYKESVKQDHYDAMIRANAASIIQL